MIYNTSFKDGFFKHKLLYVKEERCAWVRRPLRGVLIRPDLLKTRSTAALDAGTLYNSNAHCDFVLMCVYNTCYFYTSVASFDFEKRLPY